MDLNYKDLDGVLKLLLYNNNVAESMDELVIRLAKNNDFEFLHRIAVIDKDFTPEFSHLKPLFLLLEKLDSEGLISTFNSSAENTNEFTYAIKYNGIEFLSQGGFAAKAIRDKLKEEKNKKEKTLMQIATVCSVIVGTYYFLLLMKEFVFPSLHRHKSYKLYSKAIN